MKRGFLGSGGGAAPAPKPTATAAAAPGATTTTTTSPATTAAAAATTVAATTTAAAASTTDPAGRTRRWAQCLELLRSPTDERKLVGLLLVTKLVRQPGAEGGPAKIDATDAADAADAATESARELGEALEAVGAPFLRRLLLPLTRRHQRQQKKEQHNQEEPQQQAAGASLALAILATACRVAGTAAATAASSSSSPPFFPPLLPDVLLEMAPVLLKVASEGGVNAALGIAGSDEAEEQGAASSSSASAAADALECALFLCEGLGSQSREQEEEALGVVLDSGGLAAASRALSRALAQQSPSSPASTELALTLPLRLLSALLRGPPASSSSSSSWRQSRLEAECPQDVADAAEAAAAALAPAATPGRARLEALRALLLALPEVEQDGWRAAPSGAELLRRRRASGWPADAHAGIARLLSGRGLGPVQKLSALRVAAACVAGLGAAWLLPQPSPRSPPSPESPPPLMRALASTLAIEVPLLLSDALNPDARVPAGEDATDAAGQWRAPEARSLQREQERRRERRWPKAPVDGETGPSNGRHAADVEDDEMWSEDAEAGGSEAMMEEEDEEEGAGKATAERREQQQRQQPRPPRPTISAGERAMAGLPACFSLLEAAVGALVSADDDDEADQDGDDGDDPAATLRAAMAGVALSPPSNRPALAEADQLRAFGALRDAVGAALDFVAARAEEEEQEEKEAADASAASRAVLLLGATRVVGRLLAEAPDALDAAKLSRALPLMLRAQDDDDDQEEATGAAFLLPAVFQWGTDAAAGSTLLRAICASTPAVAALARLAAASFDAQPQIDWDRAYMAAHACARTLEEGGCRHGGSGGGEDEALAAAATAALPALARWWRRGGAQVAAELAAAPRLSSPEAAAVGCSEADALMAAARLAAALLPVASKSSSSFQDDACALVAGALGAGLLAQAVADAGGGGGGGGFGDAAAEGWCAAAANAAAAVASVPQLAQHLRASEWWGLVVGNEGGATGEAVREVVAQAVELRLLVKAVLG
jgi:hypothetical protein